ncbi:MAG: hypothetical protein QM621_01415 [Aeromicrobium sp.]|uniref:hypothetical protein n=1 Tax=Aeromicrobium sp. TaxID=1871063 RepID=UPI0039E6D978
MRSPGRKRPQKRAVAQDVSSDVLARCAAWARYVGSPEHKTFPSFAGPAQARSDATKCPTHIDNQEHVTSWLREAILAGNVSAAFDDDFPRYVWAHPEDGGAWFEARLTNKSLGEYKGYPLDPSERPSGAV